MSDRRQFLREMSALSLAWTSGCLLRPNSRPRFDARAFPLGIASGDPTPDGVVLWTRLMPDAAHATATIPVRWEIASDESMRTIVRSGDAMATPQWGHSVHVELTGLAPGRWYWYRFQAGDDVSPIGRTRTAPAAGTPTDRMRIAVASCQHWEQGYYTAYEHMAKEEIDLVLFLGDYIYESTLPFRPRAHGSGEPVTLAEYRERYALYRSDPHLQAAHAAFPWIVTWDDHEVQNNYANAVAQDAHTPRSTFLKRRAAAYRAYYENMPLRRANIPNGPDALLYRTLAFGSLARFDVLDTRQYRSDQACGDGSKSPCDEWRQSQRTMMGETQERWLRQGLGSSRATWNVLAQQVLMGGIDDDPGPGVRYPMDPWTGYPAARSRLTSFLADAKIRNPVVLTGDIHSSFAMEVRRELTESSPTVASEYVCTSISSGGNGSDAWPNAAALARTLPWWKYHNNRRGYLVCDVTPERWRSSFRVVPVVDRPGGSIQTHAVWVTESGHPGMTPEHLPG